MKKIIVLLLLSTITLNSCKKYEEGPRLSWYSKKARINGTWTFFRVTYNGIDSTRNFFESSIIFDKNGTLVYVNQEHEEAVYAVPGTWELIQNKELIRFKMDTNLYPFYAGDWEIMRLNYYDFWMEITDTLNNRIRWELLK